MSTVYRGSEGYIPSDKMIQKALNLSLCLNLTLLTGCASIPPEVACALREKFYTEPKSQAKAHITHYENNTKLRKAAEQAHYCRPPKTQVEKEKINELKLKTKKITIIEKIVIGIVVAAGFVASIPFVI